MSGTHAKDEGRLRSQSGEVCNKETSKSTSPKAVLDERGSHLSVIEPVSDALRTRTTKVSNDETGIFGDEILDGFHDSNNPTSSSLEGSPLMVKKLALEKLKSIRFSSRPNAGSGMLVLRFRLS
ncbi:unnamed protein product [Toxocara canis]|uniref:Uncharacterized protein n=1 Tax=Toxocara canis TaxID=6265 RepID=A0A183V8I5_TOXCA|nr:unnamed protein product [Toxocara canis]